MSLFDELVQSLKLKLPFGICSLEINGVFALLAIAVMSGAWAYFKFFSGKKEEKEEKSRRSGGTFNLLNEGGKYDFETYGAKNYAFSRGNDQATVATTFLGPGAVVTGKQHGGKNLAAQGYSAQELGRILNAEENLRIEVRGDGLKEMMVVESKPTNTVEDVRMEVQKRAKLEKEIVMMRNGEKLPDEMTLAEANKRGLVWRAKFIK